MSPKPIDFGSFLLESRVGAGGMGEVWKGRHRKDDVDVAVKVLTGERARVALYREDFRREVQAVARLNHPHIVMVYDYGLISETAEIDSRGTLVAGSPYLVMEYASKGALDDCRQPLSWAEIRQTLHAVLNALGHCHARGLIHRDIKPGNILRASEDDLRPTLKLTDFGLTHASEKQTSTRGTTPTTDSIEDASGTPAYMAPEQFRGRWRDYGPWTDLYALGVVAYELINGRPPYVSDDYFGYADFHLYQSLPALDPKMAVPAGFEVWLNRMTAKAIRHRFRRAADAAWALSELGEPETKTVHTFGVPLAVFEKNKESSVAHDEQPNDCDEGSDLLDEMNTLPFVRDDSGDSAASDGGESAELIGNLDTLIHQPPEVERENSNLRMNSVARAETVPALDTIDSAEPHGIELKGDLSQGLYGADMEMVAPPFPERWQDAVEVPESVPLMGVGLGLYGLREIPLVDRREARDQLWSRLQQTQETGQPQCVVLEGVSGTGKSQLARWLCELADEVGMATVLRATHEPNPGTVQGLARMMADFFRIVGMPFEAAEKRLTTIVRREGVENNYEWRALAEFVSPLTETKGSGRARSFEFSSPRQRFVLLHRFLRRLGRSRPVVVWLDDVQWGMEALMMATHVLKEAGGGDTPVLFVLTARSESLAERPMELQILKELYERNDVFHREIGSLSPQDTTRLVKQLLGLSGELADRVTGRSDGNPLFAVELVGDWVDRGVLEPGPEGFILRDGEQALLPDDLHTMWRERVEHILVDYEPSVGQSLELASVLGQEVAALEWKEVCADLGLEISELLMERLVKSRLIIANDNGWSFAHGMLRESLERLCRTDGRFQQFHEACAAMLSRLYTDQKEEMAERRGHHVIASGDLERGADLLLVAAQYRSTISEFERVHQILDRRELVLDELGASVEDRRRIRATMLRAETDRLNWQFDEAATAGRDVLEVAEANDWTLLQAEALALLAHVERQCGDVEMAVELNQRARQLFKDAGYEQGIARTTLAMAIFDRVRGNLESSRAHYQKALKFFDALGERKKVGEAYYGLGLVERQSQNLALARKHCERARGIFDQIGGQQLLANCLNGLAEIARYDGDLDQAEQGYQKALELFESIGAGDRILPRLNLGLVYQAREEYPEARRCFEAGLTELEETGQRGFMGWTHANLLPSVAMAGDWESWDDHYERAAEMLGATGLVDADIARAATFAGELARDRGFHDRAIRSFELAREQWRSAGDDERADAVAERLKEMI